MKNRTEKRCYMCGEVKPADEFYKNSVKYDGLSSECRYCAKKRVKRWAAKNVETVKRRNQEIYQKYKSVYKKRARLWYRANREAAALLNRVWAENNKEKVAEIKKRCDKKRRLQADVKLSNAISGGMRKSLLCGKDGRHWEKLVGYGLDGLKKHLEKQFLPGMTWDNYGEWHIDHIIPKSVFNYSSPDHIDFKRCWALKNLRPMWAGDNMKKWKKLNQPFQPMLPLV